MAVRPRSRMRAFFDRLNDRIALFGFRLGEIGCVDGIHLAHLRWRDDSRECFRSTIEASLGLIRERDPRRYARVKRHVRWIVNRVANTMGAEYRWGIRACSLELQDLREVSQDVHVAFHACLIVHEATHGVLESCGIAYDEKIRIRIERLCVLEQNRFAAKLSRFDPERYPVRLLHSEFDDRYWRWEWTATSVQRRKAFLSRFLADLKAEPDTASTGGPAKPSGVSESAAGHHR